MPAWPSTASSAARCAPPLAQDRVKLVAGDLVRLTLKRPFSEPTEPPLLAPSRGPPFFESPVIRRRFGEPVQAELFDAH